MKQITSLFAGLSMAASLASNTHAALSITSVVGGAPTGVQYVNFDDLPLGNGGGVSGGLTVSLSGTAQVVQGSEVGSHAAPFISNSNGLLFGDATESGPDPTPYLATGPGGDFIILELPGPQLYFGLLWGSVDPGNLLSFFGVSNELVGTVSGTDVTITASGNQGANGTFYVNIVSDVPFVRVEASGLVFEIDNVSYNPAVPVPEPTAGISFAAGAGLLWLRRRARKHRD